MKRSILLKEELSLDKNYETVGVVLMISWSTLLTLLIKLGHFISHIKILTEIKRSRLQMREYTYFKLFYDMEPILRGWSFPGSETLQNRKPFSVLQVLLRRRTRLVRDGRTGGGHQPGTDAIKLFPSVINPIPCLLVEKLFTESHLTDTAFCRQHNYDLF
jgi:hypothetical protein